MTGIRDRIKELRRVAAGDLLPNPKNWRQHPPAQQRAMAAALDEIGFADAMIAREIDGGKLQLIDGHLRQETAGEELVPVLVLDVSEDEADKLLATLDPLAAMATADAEKLSDLISHMTVNSDDLQSVVDGIAEDARVSTTPDIIEDQVPEPPADPITQPGDLWLLGDHRVLCGDSTNADHVARIPPFDAIVSDPPYGMNYTGTAGTEQQGMTVDQRRHITPVIGDDVPFDPSGVLAMTDGDVLLFGGDWFYSRLPDGGSWIVWDKRASEASDATPGAPFEICWSRRRQARRIIRVPWGGWFNKERGDADRHHPTQKPVAVMVECMKSAIGETVCDPFCGSGTTLIAAEQLNRTCYGMEISPQYCDVIVKRWESLTGKTAERA